MTPQDREDIDEAIPMVPPNDPDDRAAEIQPTTPPDVNRGSGPSVGSRE